MIMQTNIVMVLSDNLLAMGWDEFFMPIQLFSTLHLFLVGNNEGGRMVLGQTFTIEPMLTVGSINPVMWDDDWTVVTEDGSLSAQFEHTILVTKDGAEILTQC
ncbi:methionine aminopeptidase 1D, chloroplastic/mitochondrial-like isoform X2 [Macadamia integrifolia]|uniref:methionine aminopeptidase 1D, chloroplastic/mitochondrial-like isoform X2 n=1 Tax=Macadamia integrifolia TaxID=60698 RepID=UPI001C4EB2AD|nr:methionine aminopeptidase 1D, chloroplastic/mitochondrial-like isoform X2 [Macadamia integrifolia]